MKFISEKSVGDGQRLPSNSPKVDKTAFLNREWTKLRRRSGEEEREELARRGLILR